MRTSQNMFSANAEYTRAPPPHIAHCETNTHHAARTVAAASAATVVDAVYTDKTQHTCTIYILESSSFVFACV